jgi:hypothetical protein
MELLLVLTGGLLSIIGSFLAQYFTQIRAHNIRRLERREKHIDQIKQPLEDLLKIAHEWAIIIHLSHEVLERMQHFLQPNPTQENLDAFKAFVYELEEKLKEQASSLEMPYVRLRMVRTMHLSILRNVEQLSQPEFASLIRCHACSSGG